MNLRMRRFLDKRGVCVTSKSDSLFMRILGRLLFFNKRFMTDFYTTFGNTIYTPVSVDRDKVDVGVLAHEYVHVYDSRRLSRPLFGFLYLFPQCLSVFALCAFAAFWWMPALWFLCALVFLAPLPAPWRTYFELRGYTMSVLVANGWRSPDDGTNAFLEWVVEQFTGPNYYFMCPFKRYVLSRLRSMCSRKLSGPYEEVYREVFLDGEQSRVPGRETARGSNTASPV